MWFFFSMYFCQLYFIKTSQWLSVAFRIKSQPLIIAWSCLPLASLSIYSLPLASFSCPEWTLWCPLTMEDHILPRYIWHAISLPRHVLPFCLHLLASPSFFKMQADLASTGAPSLSLSPASSTLAGAQAQDCALVRGPWPQSTKSVRHPKCIAVAAVWQLSVYFSVSLTGHWACERSN